MAAAVIETKELSKEYSAPIGVQSYRALDELTMEVEQGEILGFLGPNGAGKTTTIKILLGIIFPTGGPPTLDEALDQALEAANANVLLDAVVNFRSFYIPWIFGETCWEAEGDAYDTYE